MVLTRIPSISGIPLWAKPETLCKELGSRWADGVFGLNLRWSESDRRLHFIQERRSESPRDVSSSSSSVIRTFYPLDSYFSVRYRNQLGASSIVVEMTEAGTPTAVAMEFPVSSPGESPPRKAPRRLVERLSESRNPPSSVEEIEAKLRDADLRRQVYLSGNPYFTVFADSDVEFLFIF